MFLLRKFRHWSKGHGKCTQGEALDGKGTTDRYLVRLSRNRERAINRVARKLRLTADQKPLLTELIDQGYALRKSVKIGNADPREELKAWFAGPTLDRERLEAFISTKADTIREQIPKAISALEVFYASLSFKQQQQIRDRLMGRPRFFGRS